MVVMNIVDQVGNTVHKMGQNKCRGRCHALAFIGKSDNSRDIMSSSTWAILALALEALAALVMPLWLMMILAFSAANFFPCI